MTIVTLDPKTLRNWKICTMKKISNCNKSRRCIKQVAMYNIICYYVSVFKVLKKCM